MYDKGYSLLRILCTCVCIMLIAVGVGIYRSGGLWVEEVRRDGRRVE